MKKWQTQNWCETLPLNSQIAQVLKFRQEHGVRLCGQAGNYSETEICSIHRIQDGNADLLSLAATAAPADAITVIVVAFI